jgi:hypothetical protein
VVEQLLALSALAAVAHVDAPLLFAIFLAGDTTRSVTGQI